MNSLHFLILELIGSRRDMVLVEQYPYIFIILLFVSWAGMSYLISYTCGWQKLAGVYKKEGEFDGRKHHFRSAGIGNSNYGGCIILGANNRELFLGMIFLLKFGHKDLLIPLAEVKGTELKKLFFFKYVNLSFKSVPKVIIQIDRRTADLIERESEEAWQYERLEEPGNA